VSRADIARLARHVLSLKRAGQLRFRAETFGLYYPALQYAAPWWRVSPRTLVMLIRHAGPYLDWLGEMETISRKGGPGWWDLIAPERSGRSTLPINEVLPVGLDSSRQ
jgi:hypothetical protein